MPAARQSSGLARAGSSTSTSSSRERSPSCGSRTVTTARPTVPSPDANALDPVRVHPSGPAAPDAQRVPARRAPDPEQRAGPDPSAHELARLGPAVQLDQLDRVDMAFVEPRQRQVGPAERAQRPERELDRVERGRGAQTRPAGVDGQRRAQPAVGREPPDGGVEPALLVLAVADVPGERGRIGRAGHARRGVRGRRRDGVANGCEACVHELCSTVDGGASGDCAWARGTGPRRTCTRSSSSRASSRGSAEKRSRTRAGSSAARS